jgi:hypothetical protein
MRRSSSKNCSLGKEDQKRVRRRSRSRENGTLIGGAVSGLGKEEHS